jgi:hypothetical protein
MLHQMTHTRLSTLLLPLNDISLVELHGEVALMKVKHWLYQEQFHLNLLMALVMLIQ